MRRLVTLTMIVMLVAAVVPAPVSAAAVEDVAIPRDEAVLNAVLFRPEGSGPFPAVVGLHGCAGLLDRTGQLQARYRDWGERLAAAGFAVLYPDSFSPRGIDSQCSVGERRARSSRERVADANAARRWLQGKDWIKADRVALVGWSSGATSTLWAVRPRAVVHDRNPDFRSAVAFYPGCRRLGDLAWSARVPTLILIGAADDWSPAAPCRKMIQEARGRSAHAEIITYPGAYHEFDHPNQPIVQRTGLAFSADGSGRAHVATHDHARADALRRVPEWLGR